MAGRTALVTGAASGIGAALVDALLARGDRVLATDLDVDALTIRHPETRGDRLELAALDVTSSEQVDDAVARAVALGDSLDLCFNNAGIVLGGDAAAMNDADWRRIVDVNLWGVIHGTRAAYAVMRAQGGGHIVNTASMAGLHPVPYSAAYTATKHAVVGLSLALREEARAHGVRVSVVCPGVVDTGIFAAATDVGGYAYRETIARVPGRPVAPDAAARAILRGVARNRARILFPASSHALDLLGRLAPGLYARLTGFQMRPR